MVHPSTCFLATLLIGGCGADGRTSTRPPLSAPDVSSEDTAAPLSDTATDTTAPPPAALTRDAGYLITVRTLGWDDPNGILSRYRRTPSGWLRDGANVPIILGRSGVAWARGLHGDAGVPGHLGPVKREGDERSPAGAFWLNHALGYASDAPDGTRIRYQAMTPTLQCIEDVASAYYNRVVDRALITPDWDSTDRLRRDDGLYEFVLFVDQNTAPAPVAGRGSCILFHVWSSPATPTAGCTAMERDALRELVRGLAPERNMLVQLPARVYDAVAETWDLPLTG